MKRPAQRAALCCAAFLQAPFMARAGSDSTEADPPGIQISDGRGGIIAWEQFGPVRIVLKDGSVKKDCRLREIHDYWIVYEKNGSLHDQLIEKIQRIEISAEEEPVLVFDEKNRPKILGLKKSGGKTGEETETEKQ